MDRKTAKTIINKNGGKFMTVRFRKANGDMRNMNCRTGVEKHLRGGNSTTAGKENLQTVYDVVAKGYRTINLDTVEEIHSRGEVHK